MQPRARAAAPPPRQRMAQSSGSSWRTGRPWAALRAPPSSVAADAAAAAPAARISRVRAPHPTRWVPQVAAKGRSIPGAGGYGGWGGHAVWSAGAGWEGGAELGGGTELETTALTPTPRHSPGCCRLPTGMTRRPKVPRRQKGAGHFPAPAPGPSSESPGLLSLLGSAQVKRRAVSQAAARPACRLRAGARRLPRGARARAGELAAASLRPPGLRVLSRAPVQD